MNQHGECRQNLLDHLLWRWRILRSTDVDEHPSDIAQEAKWYLRRDELKQRRHNVEPNAVVAIVWAVTCAMTKDKFRFDGANSYQ